jgi:osmoprotectant transport system ATP-binding protein
VIELRELSKVYDDRRAVGPLSIKIGKGEFVALLGGSGCGKTTTLKMINGLIEPDEGEVLIEGAPAGRERVHLLRRRIGYVFQEVGLFPHMTVGENIAIGPRLAGWSRQRRRDRVGELLSLVALPSDVGRRLPAALSGGQRQRVGLARAVAAGPSIMLMDEPFGALDPLTRDDLGRDYRALHDRLGLTTVMVTHDVMEALLLADRIIVLEKGAVLADGAPAELLGDEASPAVRTLMQTPLRQAGRVADLVRRSRNG